MENLCKCCNKIVVVNISKLKNYCGINCYKRFRRSIDKIEEKIKCIICGNECIKIQSNHKYCSRKCFNVTRRKRRIEYSKVCKLCNKNFICKRSTANFCSAICSRKVYYRNKPDLLKATRKRSSYNLKEKLFNMYGRYCYCCGQSEPGFLTLDHVKNDGYKDRKTEGLSSHAIYRKAIKHYRPDIYCILCYNCNLAKAHLGICPHTTKGDL